MLHQQHQVALRERPRAVRDHHRRAVPCLERRHRLAQRLRARRVQMRVRFIENHHHRIAVEGAGEPDALALPPRERGAARRDLEVVAPRNVEDHLVRARTPGRSDYGFGVRPGVEARDVLRHRPGEQHHFLRQPADVARKRLLAVLVERHG